MIEPLRIPPAHGSDFWLADITRTGHLTAHVWMGDATDLELLSRGLCFATQAEALACVDFLLALTRI